MTAATAPAAGLLPTDLELVERYRSTRDPAHLGALFERYVHLALGVSLRYLRNREDAEDTVMAVCDAAVLPVVLARGMALPGLRVDVFALLLVYFLGLMVSSPRTPRVPPRFTMRAATSPDAPSGRSASSSGPSISRPCWPSGSRASWP